MINLDGYAFEYYQHNLTIQLGWLRLRILSAYLFSLDGYACEYYQHNHWT
jgi:hypothetical protein